MPDPIEPKSRKTTFRNSADRVDKCLAIVAKNVPLTDELMSLLTDCRLVENRRKSASSNRRQADLFTSMATMDAASLRQLAACLRLSGHPLMAEFVLHTLAQTEAESESECMTEFLPQMILERLGLPESDETLEQLRQLFAEAHLMSWCCHLFDPAGADVMSLRRQHAEESWRSAKEVREKTAELEDLKAKLSALQAALKESGDAVAHLESRLSQLTSSAESVSSLKSYRSAVALARSEIHRFFEEAEAAAAATADGGESVPDDDSRLLTAFKEEFTVGFLARCRHLLEERRQMARELADRDRRIAALIRNSREASGDIKATDGDPGSWMEDGGSGTGSPEHKRSPAMARAWDEITPNHNDRQEQQQQLDPRRRYSVLPGIPHSHRKATKRDTTAAAVKKREPAGKPLSANVVSLF